MSASDLFRAYAQRPVKHKVFISYHHHGDQAYYDAFSKAFHDTYEAIYDNSLDRSLDSDNTDYVIQRIRDSFISGSSCTIVLVGKDTWGRKYVDWEIKATLDKEHGLIGVRLPSAPVDPQTRAATVPPRLHDNVQSGFALWITWQQVTANAGQLNQYVTQAKSRDVRLIRNNRERRLRNA
jgi:hypothetical protein